MNAPVILVTGAARRIGAEIARTLHSAGARLALHYHSSRDEAEQLAHTLNTIRADSAIALSADLADSATLSQLVNDVVRRFGRLDGLVNNASSFYATPFGTIDETSWQRIVDSNLKGPLFLAQAAALHLAQNNGSIVNITDIHVERPLKGYAVYSLAKAGLANLTRSLAIELAPQVRVNAVAPGAILWPDDDSFDSPQRAAIIANTPLKRIGSPQDIARAVRFLLFEAPFITGQTINVDGGRSVYL